MPNEKTSSINTSQTEQSTSTSSAIIIKDTSSGNLLVSDGNSSDINQIESIAKDVSNISADIHQMSYISVFSIGSMIACFAILLIGYYAKGWKG